VLGSASSSDAVGLARATKNDPWDGRPSREEAFRQKLAAAAPASTVWYYCDSSKSFYPYVSQCAEGWKQVPATPPQ
jgi:hypothetical protein